MWTPSPQTSPDGPMGTPPGGFRVSLHTLGMFLSRELYLQCLAPLDGSDCLTLEPHRKLCAVDSAVKCLEELQRRVRFPLMVPLWTRLRAPSRGHAI